MEIKPFLSRCLDRLRAEKTEKEEGMSNKVLLAELVAHFKSQLKELSVGHRMIYPMSFNVLMHPEDYEKSKQSFPFVLPEVVAAFYGVIEDSKEEYPIYTAPAKYWFFQFSACGLGQLDPDDDKMTVVQKGKITTLGSLLAFDLKEKDTITEEERTRVSIKLADSNVHGANVNWDAIKDVNVISDGIFTYQFDDTLNRDSRKIAENSNRAETEGLATLTYARDGKNIHYLMKDNLIHVSGKNDLRKGRSIFKIESDEMVDSHLQVKYDREEGAFMLAAFAPARLNGRNLNVSMGSDIIWYDLADNSRIFIAEAAVSIDFEIKK
ncbi:MAG: hypothetical protein NC324_01920 [Bacteroides sp.]|nr:hypothetical protein [Bacteroides sp.]